MVLCAAYGCNSRSDRGDKISFHQFPKDNKLRKLWIAKINRGESAVKLFKPTHHKLCGKHFEDDQFEASSILASKIGFGENVKKRLKSDAVPTIFKEQPEVQSDRRSAARIQEKKLKNEVMRIQWGCGYVLDHRFIDAPIFFFLFVFLLLPSINVLAILGSCSQLKMLSYPNQEHKK